MADEGPSHASLVADETHVCNSNACAALAHMRNTHAAPGAVEARRRRQASQDQNTAREELVRQLGRRVSECVIKARGERIARPAAFEEHRPSNSGIFQLTRRHVKTDLMRKCMPTESTFCVSRSVSRPQQRSARATLRPQRGPVRMPPKSDGGATNDAACLLLTPAARRGLGNEAPSSKRQQSPPSRRAWQALSPQSSWSLARRARGRATEPTSQRRAARRRMPPPQRTHIAHGEVVPPLAWERRSVADREGSRAKVAKRLCCAPHIPQSPESCPKLLEDCSKVPQMLLR